MINARTLLFVPATSERKIDKAFAGTADAVIIDLEDAVAVVEKPAARKAFGAIVAVPRQRTTWVRINATSTPFCYQDLLATCVAGVAGIVLPKVESAEEVRMVDWILTQLESERQLPARGIPVMGIIETARGLVGVDAIAAASPRLRRLMFGAVDLAADLGVDIADDTGATTHSRFAVACASRAAGLEAPMDTAYTDIPNVDGLRATTERARGLGYRGKACIHPSQVDVVNAVFTPTEKEIAWAQRVVDAFAEAERQGLAAITLDGQMLDYPVVERARRVLAQRR
jgi:citrate lyase subunit beta/citryl-CoA lyase